MWSAYRCLHDVITLIKRWLICQKVNVRVTTVSWRIHWFFHQRGPVQTPTAAHATRGSQRWIKCVNTDVFFRQDPVRQMQTLHCNVPSFKFSFFCCTCQLFYGWLCLSPLSMSAWHRIYLVSAIQQGGFNLWTTVPFPTALLCHRPAASTVHGVIKYFELDSHYLPYQGFKPWQNGKRKASFTCHAMNSFTYSKSSHLMADASKLNSS